MGRFVPGFGGLKRGIDLIMFGKQSILPCANFYASGEKTGNFGVSMVRMDGGRWRSGIWNSNEY